MMGINPIDKSGGENIPPILPSDTAKFDASAQDSTTTARQENVPMSQDQVAQEQAYEQQTNAALVGQLASEDYDADWAGNFQADLDQSLKTEIFMGTHLSDVECKSSLCRVTLAHDNPETEEQFFEHMLELPVMSNTQAYYQRESHGDGSASLGV